MQPRLFMHGHYHVKDEVRFKEFEQTTHVVALDCDGSPDGNVVVISLPDRDSGSMPSIEWLT